MGSALFALGQLMPAKQLLFCLLLFVLCPGYAQPIFASVTQCFSGLVHTSVAFTRASNTLLHMCSDHSITARLASEMSHFKTHHVNISMGEVNLFVCI